METGAQLAARIGSGANAFEGQSFSIPTGRAAACAMTSCGDYVIAAFRDAHLAVYSIQAAAAPPRRRGE